MQEGWGGILHGGVPFVPRTHRLRHESVPNLKPPEFAALLIERLEKVKRDRESQEKVQQSFKKIQEGDNVSDECRRQHAFNSLPPSLLLDKLNQKIPLDDVDPCQSILDEHVSRVWQDSNNDTPARSPGSPRPKSPSGRRPGTQPRPLPLSSKGMVSGTHPSMYVSGSSYLPSVQPGHQGHLRPATQLISPWPPSSTAPWPPSASPPWPSCAPPTRPSAHPYQASKNWHHTRRRDRGQDVNSTFSSDSGNVADYYESNERGALHPLPKSRSMPEYMENYAGTSSDGGSSGRRQSSGRRSSSRRPPADLTDSGVSVVSDSGPSLAPSASSTERVTSWLLESDKFSGSGSTSSVYPEHEWDPRLRGSRSTHTAAGATSPGTLRRSGSSGGRRSVSGGSVGGSGTLANTGSNVSASGSLSGGSVGGGRSGSLDRGPAGWVTAAMEQGGHMGHGMHAPHIPHSHAVHGSHASHSEEKRRSRGGGSSRSGGHSSSHGWGHPESGSNPSFKALATNTSRRVGFHSRWRAWGGGGGSGSVMSTTTESTTVIYNFHDDDVPFVTRIPTRPVTLRRFKQHLPKKGNYRFFFKKQCEEFGVIQEEVTDDQEILPLFDGKIFAQIRKAD
ncbi:Axin-1 [Penaeus vannamei]|uniref:Axin-1 n=1 Tax=Penaeus vannamei TaxID=6689 RepID=A0A423T9U1_PENVA|nr:Axin-1 [Penaeus vannamei]